MFRTRIIFGGTMDNYISDGKVMKCRIQIYKKYWKFIAFKLETIDVRLSLTPKQTALYQSALDRLSKCVRHFESF